MKRLVAFCVAAFAACSVAPAAAAEADRPAEVEVVRDGARWTATFRLPRAAPAWVFIRSPVAAGDRQPYRTRSWTVLTPGVRLERRGRYDTLVAEHGNGIVPRTVRVRFTPVAEEMVADYTPALVFSDGAVALFDQQFSLFPVPNVSTVRALPADLNGYPIEDSGTRVRFRDRGGEVMHAGRRQREVTLEGAPSYVLFGARNLIETEATAALIDPALPRWLAHSLGQMTPAILSRYAAELGPAPAGKPTLLVSWAGPTPRRASMNGGVVGGIVVMRFEGEQVLQANPEMRNLARWFIAHEGAHFWLGEAVRYEASRDAWIMEGGADLLAVRTVAAMDPAYDARAFLNQSIADCARFATGHGVASAEERGEHRAYYACGAVFGLVAEAASRRPFERFVRTLLDANREDGVLTRAEWLAELDQVSGDTSLGRDVAALLDRGAPDPKSALASLMRRAGVRITLAEDGTPRLS